LFFDAAMQGQRTLQDLINAKACLQIVCRRCRHAALIFPMDLIGPDIGWDATVAEVSKKVRCSKCGAKTANVYEAAR
jgi:hypothetical protein